VRSYLHSYLYSTKEEYFEGVLPFLEVFGRLNGLVDPAVISQNIATCDEVSTAFSQVVGGINDEVAHGRLLQLYHPR
jgi:hypothetical protein